MKRRSFSLSTSQHDHLDQMAGAYGISSAEYIRRLIDKDRRALSRPRLFPAETLQNADARGA